MLTQCRRNRSHYLAVVPGIVHAENALYPGIKAYVQEGLFN